MPIWYQNQLNRVSNAPFLMIILAFSSFGAFFLQHSYLLMIVFAILFGGGYNGMINTVSAAAQEWADPRDLWHVTGVTFSFYTGGGMIGGPLFGVLMHSTGFSNAGLISVTLFMILGLSCSLLLANLKQLVFKEHLV